MLPAMSAADIAIEVLASWFILGFLALVAYWPIQAWREARGRTEPEDTRGTAELVLLIAGAPFLLTCGCALVALVLTVPAALTWLVASEAGFHLAWAQIVIGGSCALVAVMLGVGLRRGHAGPRWKAGVAGLLAAGLAAFGYALLTYEDRRVSRYCAYGAVSTAQLDGCASHVRVSDFASSDTEAARYGRYEIDECGRDAGPLCGDGTRQKRAGGEAPKLPPLPTLPELPELPQLPTPPRLP